MIIPKYINHYEIDSILGQNYNQGRITYLAYDRKNNLPVVIKQFLFATTSSHWSGYKALEKEINILKELNYPNIPKYITQIESNNGLCLVQEYIDAPNCEISDLSKAEIYLLTKQLLSILVYISSKNIVHKDIKPANILWDKECYKAYLVDFGFSSFATNNGSASSTLAGTLGFMSPSQLFRGEISPKGDLYGLGATLYVLLSGIKSEELARHLDSRWKIPVDTLKNQVSDNLINWINSLLREEIDDPLFAKNEFDLFFYSLLSMCYSIPSTSFASSSTEVYSSISPVNNKKQGLLKILIYLIFLTPCIPIIYLLATTDNLLLLILDSVKNNNPFSSKFLQEIYAKEVIMLLITCLFFIGLEIEKHMVESDIKHSRILLLVGTLLIIVNLILFSIL